MKDRRIMEFARKPLCAGGQIRLIPYVGNYKNFNSTLHM